VRAILQQNDQCSIVRLIHPALGIGDRQTAELHLTDARVLNARVDHCRGSIARPLSDHELEEKFSMQSHGVIADSAIGRIKELCWKVENLADVGIEMRKILSAG
jgi:hypothetical protein